MYTAKLLNRKQLFETTVNCDHSIVLRMLSQREDSNLIRHLLLIYTNIFLFMAKVLFSRPKTGLRWCASTL